ncbi:MAG: CZB domain-containing protein [Methylotenera sp.]|nr:CZB domain-containing protein [Methylotenera sp.]
MALFDWFKKSVAGDETVKLEIAPDEEELAGLNLKQVLDAHTAWKTRLQNALDGTSAESLDVAVVCQDNLCALGKWLYSEGKNKFSHLAEYESTRVAHSEFHLCAGEVLMEHQDGNADLAATLLRTKFRTASNRNQLELVRLFTVARR